ncbi:MAG: flagellar basal body-associated FliL family protein [Nitrospiraceae bacterium]
MAEAAQEKVAVPVAAGIPLKLVIIIVAATMIVGVGGAFLLLKMTSSRNATEESKPETTSAKTAGHAEPESKKAGHSAGPGTIVDLESFIVNLADSPEIRYLKLTIKIELDREDAADEIKARTPQIRDSILVLLTSKDSATIRTPQGKAQLRDEITQRINGSLSKPGARSAYFTDFVIQ